VARRGSGRFARSRDPVLDAIDPWQNLSAPAVDDDSVYIAPNCGAVIAVDRFDGHLRWIRPYSPVNNNNLAVATEQPVPRDRRRPANVRVRELPSTGIPRASVFRWNTTPVRVGDDMLVIAPQDSDRVFALSSRTGKNLWHTDSLAQATLFGAVGKLVFLSDRSITALDVEKLDAAWTWDGGAVGPATLSANGTSPQILVPTAGGLVTLSANDGAVVASSKSARVPDLTNIAKSETVRTAMQGTGALDLLVGDQAEPKKKTR
jgi:outer membrane protein assembly factor BamB